MLGNIVGGFVTILVGVTLVPPIADAVADSQANTNVTGASSTILGLTTLFFALAITSIGIGIASSALKRSGLM